MVSSNPMLHGRWNRSPAIDDKGCSTVMLDRLSRSTRQDKYTYMYYMYTSNNKRGAWPWGHYGENHSPMGRHPSPGTLG